MAYFVTASVWTERAFRVTSLDSKGQLFGWTAGVSLMQHDLLRRDAALRGQGATWLQSQCPAGEQGLGPFLSIGQIAFGFVSFV